MTDLGASFDRSADEYQNVRPEYPLELINDIVARAGLSTGSRILDVGCGSGQATLSFANRGYSIVAIDPGEQTLQLLRQRCSDLQNVQLIQSRFEDLDLPNSSFDLVISAQAFHWIDPAIASKKIADLLSKNGHVMLFWHMQEVPEGSPQAMLQEINAQYFDGYPTMMPPEHNREFLDGMTEMLCADGRIQSPEVSEYSWERLYSEDDFLELFRTWSRYLVLSSADKESIDSEVKNHVENLTAPPAISFRTCLIHAQV